MGLSLAQAIELENRARRNSGLPAISKHSFIPSRSSHTKDLIASQITEAKKNTRSKSGKRSDLDGRFFRSVWEANIARILNFWQQIGIVIEWEYETEEFEFHKIRRGNRFYKIDFKIRFAKESDVWAYWEVKGWMDAKSKTKLKRMAKYYPHIRIQIIDSQQYRALAQQFARSIPNWE